ncbi:probable basic-leucine zipper transcription factor O [Eurosta solidaginis]|uniref:probable basic-leucine zipper transcription factor O n=1 Tax=Eurosta solidaginis TaxID=178769 RepID=UPI0035308095
MKAKARLCPIILLICAARIVCTAQQRYNNNYAIGYPLSFAVTKLTQDEFLPDKRNKPSLSIVNPLDVLRQRLLLEIARRQMKENTRQVELNRAIMKNVGKRTNTGQYNYKFPMQTQQQWEYLLTHTPYREQTYSISKPATLHQQQQHQQLELQLQQQLLHPHYANHLEYAPDVTDYDYVQQPIYLYDGILPDVTTNDGNDSERQFAKHTSSYINTHESDAEDEEHNSYYRVNDNETTNENKNSNNVNERRNHANHTASTSNGKAIDSRRILGKNLPAYEPHNAIQDMEENQGNTGSQLRYFYGLRNKRRDMKK